MCLQVFGIDFDLSLVLKIGIKSIFYKVACFVPPTHLYDFFMILLGIKKSYYKKLYHMQIWEVHVVMFNM